MMLLLTTATLPAFVYSVEVPVIFYPFGAGIGDRTAPVNDDGSTSSIPLVGTSFPFFGRNMRQVYVNTNGGLSFDNAVSTFTPAPFPVTGVPMIAAYWSDVDTRMNNGRIHYRQTSDATLLARASNDIRATFSTYGFDTFSATWIFVATWYNVTYFGGSPYTPTSTFQCVLITNGVNSFAMFNYAKMMWTTGTASGGNQLTGLGGTPAQVGFNYGDASNYYAVPSSRTSDIINIYKQTNIGVKGRWIFRIDQGEIASAGCRYTPACYRDTNTGLCAGSGFCGYHGEQHLTTWDGHRFDYQGICKHLLVGQPSEPVDRRTSFKVFGRNVRYSNDSRATWFREVEIVYDNTRVRLTSKDAIAVVKVNGVTVKLPYCQDRYTIYFSGKFVRYQTMLGLAVETDGMYTVNIYIPSTYRRQLSGLCGNFDGVSTNDLFYNGVDYSSNPSQLGGYFVVADADADRTTNCPAINAKPPCESPPPRYVERCDQLVNRSGPFGACVNSMDSAVSGTRAAIFNNCLLDACYLNETSICQSVHNLLEECAFRGFQIDCHQWQTITQCPVACPAGMVFECNSNRVCLPTCDNPIVSAGCTRPQKGACVCPMGTLFYNGTCTSSCPLGCVDSENNIHPVGDVWSVGHNRLTCVPCSNCSGFQIVSACDANCDTINSGCSVKGVGHCDRQCRNGFLLNADFTCVPDCDTNCDLVNSGCSVKGTGRCDRQCRHGYSLYSDFTCVRCDESCDMTNSGCSIKGAGRCDRQCKIGYSLYSDFTCVRCDESCDMRISGCSIKGAGRCDVQCNVGYSLYSDFTCAYCDENCNMTNSGCSIKGANRCDSQCTSGFSLNSNFTCVYCDENCDMKNSGCSVKGADLCDRGCNSGFSLYTNFTCVSCDINCDMVNSGCSTSGYGLCDSQCNSGYSLYTDFTCVSCDENCDMTLSGCSTQGAGLCDSQCISGFSLYSNFTCVPCDENCDMTLSGCSTQGAGLCDSQCISGFSLYSNFTCVPCDENCDMTLSGCSTQGAGLCDSQCISGFSLYSDFTCVLCDANCDMTHSGCSVRGVNRCDSRCQSRYSLFADFTCVECDANCDMELSGCSTQGSGLCDSQCNNGFWFHPNFTCIEISLPDVYLIYNSNGGVLTYGADQKNQESLVLMTTDNVLRATPFTVITPCLSHDIQNSNRSKGHCVTLQAADGSALIAVNVMGGLSMLFPSDVQAGFPFKVDVDASFFIRRTRVEQDVYTLLSAPYNAFHLASLKVNRPVFMHYVNGKLPKATTYHFVPVSPATTMSTNCSNVWTLIKSARPANLGVMQGTSSRNYCLQRCLVYPNCVGVSIHINVSKGGTYPCYFAVAGASNQSMVVDTAYAHYDLSPTFPSRCTGSCLVTWRTVNVTVSSAKNSSVYSSTTQTTRIDCRDQCRSDSRCIGLAWTQGTCTLYYRDPTTGGQYVPPDTILTLQTPQINTMCSKSSSTVHISMNASDPAATLQPDATGYAACFTLCTNQVNCHGFQLQDGGACYLSLGTRLTDTVESTYDLFEVRRAPSGNGCQNQWTLYSNAYCVNSVPYVGPIAVQSEQDCRAVCMSAAAKNKLSCVGIDYNQSTNSCRLTNETLTVDALDTNPLKSNGWNHFELTQSPNCFASF